MWQKLFWNRVRLSNPNQSVFHPNKQEEIVLEMDWFFFSHTYCIESLWIILAFFKALFEGLKKPFQENIHMHTKIQKRIQKKLGAHCAYVSV